MPTINGTCKLMHTPIKPKTAASKGVLELKCDGTPRQTCIVTKKTSIKVATARNTNLEFGLAILPTPAEKLKDGLPSQLHDGRQGSDG